MDRERGSKNGAAERRFRVFMRRWGLINLGAVGVFTLAMLAFFDPFSSAVTGAFLGFLSASIAFPVRAAMDLYLERRAPGR